MIKVAVFDLGNVFVSVEPERAISELMAFDLEIDAPSFLEKLSKSEASIQFQMGRITPKEFYRSIIAHLGEHIPFDTFRAIYQNIFDPIQPMIDLLPRLSKAYTLVLLSNTDVLHIEYIDREYGFFHYFHHLLFSYEVQLVKPDPAIYQKALQLAGSKSGEAVYIDDKLENVMAAQDMGMAGIHFKNMRVFQEDWQKVVGRSIV